MALGTGDGGGGGSLLGRRCMGRLALLGLGLLAAFAAFADWEMTSMSRVWEAQVAKLSTMVPAGSATGELQATLAEPAAGSLEPRLYRRGAECGEQALDLGTAGKPGECLALVVASPKCGAHFMFNSLHPDWHCRCCAPDGTEGGPAEPSWDIYEVRQSPSGLAEAPNAGHAIRPSAPVETATAVTSKPETAIAAETAIPAATETAIPAATSKPTAESKAPAVAAPPSSEKPTTTAEPTGPPPGKYKPSVKLKSLECGEQAFNFGHIRTIEECDRLSAGTPECGNFFMFSTSHPDWACRCCAPFGEGEGPQSPHWDVYARLFPRLKTLPAIPTSPPLVDPFHGLPVADGPRPAWLAREDALVVDARAESRGGILILQAVLMDANSQWGAKRSAAKARPHWLRAILATNRAHARKHGHAMVLRAQPTQPQLTQWMLRECGSKSAGACMRQNERENFNWEKHLMMSDYLLSPQNFSHVLMLDADAALVQPQLNTLMGIAEVLEKEHKELFLTDEDWLDANGKGRINGGLMFAKNSNFTRGLFQDTFDAHVKGPALHKHWRIGVPVQQCTSNEQICLNDLWHGQQKSYFVPHAIMASGLRYNRGAERGGEAHITDPKTEVMHWMGGSKGSAGQTLCKGARDLTFEGPGGYGCKS